MCCQLGDDLAEALNTLLSIKRFDWFFIETSGLAEPLEVVHQLTTPALLASIDPRLMVAVIDIESPVPEQEGSRLLWEQARAGQVVLLNKADQIKPEPLRHTAERIRQYNPAAEIIITQQARGESRCASRKGNLTAGARHFRPLSRSYSRVIQQLGPPSPIRRETR